MDWKEKNIELTQKYNNMQQQLMRSQDSLKSAHQKSIKLKEQMDVLNKELLAMKHKTASIQRMQMNMSNLNAMELSELNDLEKDMKSGLSAVRETKTKLIENKYLCIICCENDRDMKLSGCNHIFLCQKCERKMMIKRCPICTQPYYFAEKLQF